MEVKGTVAHLLGLPRASGAKGRLPTPGSQVTATVQRYLGKGIWLLDLDGTHVEARSRLSLVPGQRLLATVKQEGRSLLLVTRERSSESITALLRGGGLSDTANGRALISLLFSAGSPARPELLDRLVAALRRRGVRPSGGRLEAEGVARGFRTLPDELGELFPPWVGSFLEYGSQNDSEPQDFEEKDKRRRSAGTLLREALLRTSPTGNHPLQLYNHRAKLGSGWIALPVRFTASEASGGPESRFQGLLHVPIEESVAPTGSWTLDLSDGAMRYIVACRAGRRVELRVSEVGQAETVRKDQGRPRAEALASLLRGAGYEVLLSELPFDGIEFKDHSDLQEGIDLLQ